MKHVQYFDYEANSIEHYDPQSYGDSGAAMSITYCNERHQFIVSPEGKTSCAIVFFNTHRDALTYTTHLLEYVGKHDTIIMNRSEKDLIDDEDKDYNPVETYEEFYDIGGKQLADNSAAAVFSISLCSEYSLFQARPLKDRSEEIDMREFEAWIDAATYIESITEFMRVNE